MSVLINNQQQALSESSLIEQNITSVLNITPGMYRLDPIYFGFNSTNVFLMYLIGLLIRPIPFKYHQLRICIQ